MPVWSGRRLRLYQARGLAALNNLEHEHVGVAENIIAETGSVAAQKDLVIAAPDVPINICRRARGAGTRILVKSPTKWFLSAASLRGVTAEALQVHIDSTKTWEIGANDGPKAVRIWTNDHAWVPYLLVPDQRRGTWSKRDFVEVLERRVERWPTAMRWALESAANAFCCRPRTIDTGPIHVCRRVRRARRPHRCRCRIRAWGRPCPLFAPPFRAF